MKKLGTIALIVGCVALGAGGVLLIERINQPTLVAAISPVATTEPTPALPKQVVWPDAELNIAKVQTYIRLLQPDHDSPKFQNVRAAGPGGVCGEVDLKNGDGDYVGVQPFAAIAKTLEVVLEKKWLHAYADDGTNPQVLFARAMRAACATDHPGPMPASLVESPANKARLEIVRQSLKDPDSAQFRNLRVGWLGGLCGEVNAKNAMGGYVGFTAFSANDTTGVHLALDGNPNSKDPDEMWKVLQDMMNLMDCSYESDIRWPISEHPKRDAEDAAKKKKKKRSKA
jgi:hypothetical protein